MLVWIWTRNDGTGILDDEFRDGDIFMVKEDSFEPSIGEMSKKAYLIAKMPDPPNKAAVMEGLVQEEWEPDSSGGTRIKRQRKYKINWREKFDARRMCGALCLQHMTNDALDRHVKGLVPLAQPVGPKPAHVNFI